MGDWIQGVADIINPGSPAAPARSYEMKLLDRHIVKYCEFFVNHYEKQRYLTLVKLSGEK